MGISTLVVYPLLLGNSPTSPLNINAEYIPISLNAELITYNFQAEQLAS